MIAVVICRIAEGLIRPLCSIPVRRRADAFPELIVFLLQPLDFVLLLCHEFFDLRNHELLLLGLLRELLDDLIFLFVLDELQLEFHDVLFQVKVLLVNHFKQGLFAVRFSEMRFLAVHLYVDQVLQLARGRVVVQ